MSIDRMSTNVERLSPYAVDVCRESVSQMGPDDFGEYVSYKGYLNLKEKADALADRAEFAFAERHFLTNHIEGLKENYEAARKAFAEYRKAAE